MTHIEARDENTSAPDLTSGDGETYAEGAIPCYNAEGTAEEQGFAPIFFDQKAEKRNFSRLGFGFAIFSMIYLAVSLIIQIAAKIIYPELLEATWFLNLISPVSIYLFGAPVLLLIVGGMRAEKPEKKKMKFSVWLMILVICLGVMYIGAFVGNGLMSFISEIIAQFFTSTPSNGLTSLIDIDNLWITAIGVVIIAPIGEELIFRKLIIDRLGRYGAFVSIFLSALMFGLMHGNFYQFFYAFGVGLIFGYVYYHTGRIWLTIALHAAVNFFGSILSTLLAAGTADMEEALAALETEELMAQLGVYADHIWVVFASIVFSSLVVSAIVSTIVLPIVLRKKIALPKGSNQLPKGKAYATVVFNVGIIVMFVVYGFEFLLSLIP